MAETRFNASAGRFMDTSTGRFISFETEAKIQLRLERIARAIEKANAGNLYSVGYLISTIAKGYIKRAAKASQPGDPPTTRKGLLRRAIRYRVAEDKQSVVIGPVASMVGLAGMAQEFGGRYRGATYPQRPFMGPALDEALPQIGPQWQGSVHN